MRMDGHPRLTRRSLLGSTAVAFAAPALAAPPASRAGPVQARVNDLLQRMTLEEKAAQLRSMWETKVGFLGEDRRFSEAKAATVLANGIGQIARPSDIRGYPEWDGQPYRSLADTVELVNAIQRFLVEK